MRKLAILAACALAACTPSLSTVGPVAAGAADTMGVPPPITAADKTALDEKGALLAEQLFQTAAKGATLAIKADLVSPEGIVKIGDLRAKSYAALVKVRLAYRAGNATSYSEAFKDFQSLIAQFIAAY